MENLENTKSNRIPSVHVAILGSVESGLPALIKSEGLHDALGAVGTAAMLSARDDAPIVLESKRLDVFNDSIVEEMDLMEGIPSELKPGVTYALKGIEDSTSISSRMVQRPSRLKSDI